jgi:hypothetical protein
MLDFQCSAIRAGVPPLFDGVFRRAPTTTIV